MTGYQDENRAKITATQMADSEITDSQLSERARKAPPPKRALTNGVRPRTKPRISPAPPASPASPASPVANSGTASRTAPKRTAPKRKVKASKVQARKAKPAAQSTARSAAPRVRAKASQRARAAPARIAPARTKRPAKSAKIAAKSTAKRTAKVAAKSTAKRTAKSLAKQKAAAPLRPKVSVVIPTYNRARWLPDAIECIRKQTLTNWELFIVDDGSTDNTREVAESYAKQDKRIHYVHQPHHGGPAAGLNRVLPKLRGDYLYKHDDDDIASPEKISKCTAWMDANPNGFAVRVRFQDDRYRANDDDGKVTTKFFNGIPLFYRIYMLREIGGWNEFYPIIEDSDMLMRAAERGWSEGEVDEVLYTYRRVEENRRQVSNALQLLGYRLILYRSQLLRQWGLPDLTRHSSSFRRLLRFCYAQRRAYLPRALQGHWQKGLRLDVPTDPDMNELWSAQCTPMRSLTHQKPRFPWGPLWSVWAYAAGFMRSAHMPWRMRLPIFRYIARVYYFDWRSKQQAQDRFAFRQRNDILGMARSQPQLRLPQVSVGLVTCRADKGQAARVRRALDSIAAQSLKNWELLVLDNRSTAETRRLLQARAKSEPRLRLMRGVRPLALAEGLNSLLAHARGQFFCRQDEAGESDPQRLKSSVAWLQRHPNAYALSTGVELRNGTRTRACPHRMPLFLRMGVVDYLRGWRALGQVLDEP
ncbi:MAG: glycosyltransferase, partial [Hyphomicrobiales bacterium]|nr:glycosyltransferase [Hyphomicrobiales bacterium]